VANRAGVGDDVGQYVTERSMEIEELRSHAGRRVHVHLTDGSEHVGTLRTDLLSERSISVFLSRDGDDGATIYIEQITAVRPAPAGA
jgi:hypothetical protein